MSFSDYAAGQTVDGYTLASASTGFVVGTEASATHVLVEGVTSADLDGADNFVFL